MKKRQPKNGLKTVLLWLMSGAMIFVFGALYQYICWKSVDWKELVILTAVALSIPLVLTLIFLCVVHGRRILRKRKETLYDLKPLSVRQEAAEEKKSIELSFCIVFFLLFSGIDVLNIVNMLQRPEILIFEILSVVLFTALALTTVFVALRLLLKKTGKARERSEQDRY